jgi:hypothetical protein
LSQSGSSIVIGKNNLVDIRGRFEKVAWW